MVDVVTSQQVYLRDRSAQTSGRAAALEIQVGTSHPVTVSGLPFSRGFADFRENEVSESAKKKPNPRKKIRPDLFLKRQLKLTQTASKLQPRADDSILHLVFALRYEISRDQPVAIVF